MEIKHMDSGEVDGFFNTWTSSKVTSLDKMKSGEWVVLAQLCEKPMKDLIVPNVPTIPMIARSEEQRLLLKYGTSTPNDFGKVYVLPPGTPADRAQALEVAFERAMKDKDLLAEAEKGHLDFDPLIGNGVHKLVTEFLGMGMALILLYVAFPIPIYGTIWVLLIAYVTRFIPYGMVMEETSVIARNTLSSCTTKSKSISSFSIIEVMEKARVNLLKKAPTKTVWRPWSIFVRGRTSNPKESSCLGNPSALRWRRKSP